MNIFSYLSYREIIKKLLSERRRQVRLTYAALAERARIQKTYLSKVIHGTADLNADQMHLLCEALDIAGDEYEYMQLLLERTRTTLASRREILTRKISRLQAEHLDSKKVLRAESVDPAQQLPQLAAYYLDPYALLVHTFLSVPRYQKDPQRVAAALGLSPTHLQRLFRVLAEAGILEWRGGQAHFLKAHLQLAKNSPLSGAHQALIKNLSSAQIARVEDHQKFSLLVTFSANEKTRAALHERLLDFLKTAEPLVQDAPAEDVYQMNLELFPWSLGKS